ncbi:MAG: NAD-dependent succinate-semialdehyde dehydrogenase [Aureispira sp.]
MVQGSRTIHYSINPLTNSIIAEHEEETWEAIAQKITSSQIAFDSWRQKSFEERGVYFKRAAALLRSKKETYAALMTNEMGKLHQQGLAEVEKCAWVCEYYADKAAEFLAAETLVTEQKSTLVHYQPLGTILQVMPWNFPFWQVFRFAAPTLMAGNVTLLKHALNVLGCAKAITALFKEAGFPDNVFQDVIANNEQVAKILEATTVQGVALTGSVGAGKAVGRLAGNQLKTAVLELGGSDPFIVLKDADLAKAAKVAVQSRMNNSGQTCISAKRMIVEAPVADAFLRLVKEEIKKLVVGAPDEPTTNIGALARMDLAENLQQQVEQSVALGATIEIDGGHQEGTCYFHPMLLTNVQKGMPAYEEELFGPVAVFFKVKDIEEAITLANDSIFGLGGTVFSKDEAVAQAVALRLEVGAVSINKIMSSDPRVPFGGVKQSGIGRELGREGVRTFVNLKAIVVGT